MLEGYDVPFKYKRKTVYKSISSMLKVIEHLTIESMGKFFNYDSEELPW